LSPRVARGQVELQVEPFGATAPPDGTVRNARGSEGPNDPPVPNPTEARRQPPGHAILAVDGSRDSQDRAHLRP
jgi:hypothetical protein